MPLKNVNYKKDDFFPLFLCHKDPLNKNNESICQILWPLSFENGLLKMKKGPKIVKNPVRKKNYYNQYISVYVEPPSKTNHLGVFSVLRYRHT